jgi:hypothetical protein
MPTKTQASENISVRLPADIRQRLEKDAAAHRVSFSRALINRLTENMDGPSWRAIDHIAADLRVVSDRQHAVNLMGDLLRAVDNLLGALARGDQQQIETATIDTRKAVDVINLTAQLDLRRAHTTGQKT